MKNLLSQWLNWWDEWTGSDNPTEVGDPPVEETRKALTTPEAEPSQYVILPRSIYDTLIDAANSQIQDVETGMNDGVYMDEDGENSQLLSDLQEAVDYVPKIKPLNALFNVANSDPAHPDGSFPSALFSSFEVHPCIVDENDNVSQADTGGKGYRMGDDGQTVPIETKGETPDFWSVYIRYNPLKGEGEGLDCIADAMTENEAIGFKNLLEQLVSKFIPE